jgi:hypothetical protein
MSQKPVIIQFEADDFYSTTLDLVFYNMNLDPPIKITNREELRAVFEKIEKKQIVPDIAIIDSFLEINNEDGQKIAERLRKFSPTTKIVGYAIMETNDWADYSIIKSDRDKSKTIVKILEEVLGVKFNYSEMDDPEYNHPH